jgi:hypothetical protein
MRREDWVSVRNAIPLIDNHRERRWPFVGCLAIGMMLALPACVLSIGPFM